MSDAWLVIFHFGPTAAIIKCLPAVGKLKRSIPDCLLAWVTDEYHAELVMENSLVDKVIVHPAGWRRRGLAAWIRALFYTGNALQRLHPSLIIDFNGGIDCWILEKIVGVIRTPGKATAFTALPASTRAYGYQESASGRLGFNRLMSSHGLTAEAPFIVLAPFANAKHASVMEECKNTYERDRLPADAARVVSQVARHTGIQVLIIGQRGYDAQGASLARKTPNGFSIFGSTGWLVLREGLRQALLVLGCDPDVAALAAAVGIPYVDFIEDMRPGRKKSK